MGDLDCLMIKHVAGLTRFSWAAIHNSVRLRRFPQPVKLGAASRWRRSDVTAWLDAQSRAAAERDREVARLAEV